MKRQSTPAPRRKSPASQFGRIGAVIAAVLGSGTLASCAGVQSALDPAAGDAALLLRLTELMTIGGAVIFLAVMSFLAYAIWAPHRYRRWLASRSLIVGAGFVFPAVVLTVLLTYGLWVLRVTNAPAIGDALVIEVTGEQYWWRVRYPAEGDRPAFVTANEIQVPVGRPVRILLESADVIHSFWIPNFAGKLDMIPGRQNLMQFTAERPGIYRGVCAEFCGDQHARMAFDVVALSPDEFAAWRERQGRPAAPASTPFLQLGKAVFDRGGCGSCHAVRGSGAEGRLGPDLTHVGSRRSIGAGSFPNNIGTLAGWIADVQHLKAGARMPSYGSLSGEELRAVAGYLEQLK